MTPERAQQTAAVLRASGMSTDDAAEALDHLRHELSACLIGQPVNDGLLRSATALAELNLPSPPGYHWAAEQEGASLDVYLAADGASFDPDVAKALIHLAMFAADDEVLSHPYVTSRIPGPDGEPQPETPHERAKRVLTAGFMHLAEQCLITLPPMAVLNERIERGIPVTRKQT